MQAVTGVFTNRNAAEQVLVELRQSGFPRNRLGLLTPGTPDAKVERLVPVTDTEDSGIGKAMGAAVGGAMGAAGGATLGAVAATLLIPGVGPVMAIGLIGAALFATAGAVTGAAAGEALDESLGEGLPHEDLYIYEEALRRGHSVVIALAEESSYADRATEIMTRNRSLDIDELRETWWSKLRGHEESHYQQSGRDFERDEVSYRRGFQAALHPHRRGQSYAQCEPELRKAYDDGQLDTAFRHGFERGVRYQDSVTEKKKV